MRRVAAAIALVAVAFAASAVLIRLGWRRDAIPPPPVREMGPVRVVASKRSTLGALPAVPQPDASSAVRIVCGCDSATAGRYLARASALRSISRRRDLSPGDVAALMGYLVATNDTMGASRTAGLKNDVLNLLRNQDEVPRDLAQVLVEMIECGEYDATITDYCIQHLGAMWRDFAGEGEKAQVRAALVAAASRRDLAYAGTALFALADEPGPSQFARGRLRALTVSLLRDESANELARISAIQLAGRSGYKEALPSVRRILSASRPPTVLAMASVGALGSLGGPEDVPLLEELRDSGGVRLRPAVESALARTGKRLAEGGVSDAAARD